MTKILMKAPQGTVSAEIEGHTYDIPQKGKNAGVIEVRNAGHIETLKRHGFEDHFEDDTDWAAWIDKQTDEDKLVEFIEERGGTADNSMTVKKLRKAAHAVLEG